MAGHQAQGRGTGQGSAAPCAGRSRAGRVAAHAAPLEALLVGKGFDGDVRPNEPMARHTTYRIGGPARFFVNVHSLGALGQLVGVCQAEGVPWVVVGRGSNLLVADEGFPGVVITLGRDFRNLRMDAQAARCVAGAGALLATVVQEAFRAACSGLEFAVGTPGTIGGALRMNAGTRDEGIGARVASVAVLEPSGAMVRKAGSDIEWGYRTTSFAPDETILECELALEPGDALAMQRAMESKMTRRKSTQPLGKPSCGSVFRNPEGASVGALIDGLGLKGASVGGARVSDVHANFIVNEGGATAADVRALIDLVRGKVSKAHGIELVPEVRFLGFDA
ncbi:MAG: UDP-N-acetylmuramate dehydrogenase [Eggerthellaceae bacterium]|jgi:UDP-N-acetylmuramate dehydrogenase|nr:UDP-N-acetylmuramate dehydrogenase [Eggerthellaceae bacterium]